MADLRKEVRKQIEALMTDLESLDEKSEAMTPAKEEKLRGQQSRLVRLLKEQHDDAEIVSAYERLHPMTDKHPVESRWHEVLYEVKLRLERED